MGYEQREQRHFYLFLGFFYHCGDGICSNEYNMVLRSESWGRYGVRYGTIFVIPVVALLLVFDTRFRSTHWLS